MKLPFWRKKIREKQNNNSSSENNYERNNDIYNWKLSETAPSCNECAATIVTEHLMRTGKGTGTACLAFLKEIRTLFPRIPESGGVSGRELKLIYMNF